MDDAEYQAALAIALKKLHAADRFESEVRRALSKFSPETVDRVVATLAAKRFVNDGRTLGEAVDRNTGKRALGDALLKDRLIARGASETAVEEQLAQAAPESERIREILRAKYQPTDSPAKAGRFLFGRGFSEDAIESALEEYFVRNEVDEFSESGA